MISLFGLIIAGLFVFKSDVWNANWSHAWDIQKLTKSADGTINYEPLISGVALGAMAAGLAAAILNSVTKVILRRVDQMIGSALSPISQIIKEGI